MQISDILSVRRVFVDIKADTKRELLQGLSVKAGKYFGVEDRMIFDALLERESLCSTGLGNGTAIPHARLSDLNHVKIFFVRLDTPIDFDAVDGQPVDLVCLLISPEDCGADHLSALSLISTVFKDSDKCKKIRKAKNKDDIYSILVK